MAKTLQVALNRPRTNVGLASYAKHIASCMTGNPYFPSPTLPLATFTAHIADLDTAQVATLTRAQGTAAERNAKRVIVLGDLAQLRTYVQSIANQYGDEASSVIVSSGMSIKGKAGPKKQPFAAKQEKLSGSVTLAVRHPGRGVDVAFDWQSSTDAGAHWTELGQTTAAKLRVDGLAAGTRYGFRYRRLVRNAWSDWSDPLMLLVL